LASIQDQHQPSAISQTGCTAAAAAAVVGVAVAAIAVEGCHQTLQVLQVPVRRYSMQSHSQALMQLEQAQILRNRCCFGPQQQ
jgi:hypothetical protein